MKIVVGLGNIGEKYARTRHNCGFIAMDELVRQVEESGVKVKWKEDTKLKAITTKILLNNEITFLAKPTTLMNRSGESVSQILNFFKEPAENLIAVYDDLDLPLGTIRIRDKGSAGTHNGMKSIIEQIGTQEFKRIRIGIESRGELAPAQQDTSSYVLSNFTEKEIAPLKKSIEEAVEELKSQIS
ncbi:aminoacyl-tRNA hydrolase [Candidatus Peregrinibacteria bacterium]|jgi:peptidyl-tRNA hydrolase, PTH1 family|nr:aminoacyl-tRNA hydrolase [Candidatus Peregrinibacteria bacterium]MBT7736123.1 aminoacyl-tRNA hydrolase [Candidatus Peregrinibacteria bacterium]